MFRLSMIISAVLLFALLAFNVQAACTYNGAVMAYNSGNLLRGHALMKMAARDGDRRAVQFLGSNDRPVDTGKAASKMLLVLDSSTDALTTVQSTAEKIN